MGWDGWSQAGHNRRVLHQDSRARGNSLSSAGVKLKLRAFVAWGSGLEAGAGAGTQIIQ